MAIYKIGSYSIDPGKKFTVISRLSCDSDDQAEAAVRQIGAATDMDGNALLGLRIRRGANEWFCRF